MYLLQTFIVQALLAYSVVYLSYKNLAYEITKGRPENIRENSNKLIKIFCENFSSSYLCITKCKRQRHCGDTKMSFKVFNDDLRNAVLDVHNSLRERVARGGFYGFPSASNMEAMKYSKVNEFMAGCLLKMCSTRKVFQVRPDIDTGELVQYGINRRTVLSTAKDILIENQYIYLRKIISNWATRYRDLLRRIIHINISRFINKYDDVLTGEAYTFTQIIWATTAFVGCAQFISKPERALYHFDVVCAYSPGGNIMNKPVYIIGSPGNDCEVQNEHWQSLCGKSRRIFEDYFIPPVDLNIGHNLILSTCLQFILLALFIYMKF